MVTHPPDLMNTRNKPETNSSEHPRPSNCPDVVIATGSSSFQPALRHRRKVPQLPSIQASRRTAGGYQNECSTNNNVFIP
ncbi:hypothetical protein DPMN_055510 [Dreissena polymorpha]|uniref:Uncharacterized protein n=1 Tax=Dreissena polymorpha TaxID=45954 RepID=A0A9D4CRS4_DREPO|nr:hypothetical protein DPMN_055510 [Dreissena polymorpha]